MNTNNYYRVWADIDLDAVKENIRRLQERLHPGVKTCAVIKADGYGHGAVPIATHVGDIVDFFAAATIGEALNLRANQIKKPILILGFINPEFNEEAIRQEIRLTVFTRKMAQLVSEAAERAGKPAKIHIKIDTGMGRIGFLPNQESLQTILEIAALPGIEIEGIFTHFHDSDSADLTSAYEQLRIFKEFCSDLEHAGLVIPIRHCSNSAAATNMPEANMDMVRLGVSIYGMYPSGDVKQVPLVPAFSLKSHVIYIKEIREGMTVSYGATFKASRTTRVATIPVGYADGYMRNLSNRGYVLIRGKRALIIGRVCMDQFMVDVTELPDVQENDEVVLIGTCGSEEITMEEISKLAGTFNYEFACDIGKRVPRVFYAGGSRIGSKNYFYDDWLL